MTRMVQVAVAGDVTEAEELESILQSAGIATQLEPAAVAPFGSRDQSRCQEGGILGISGKLRRFGRASHLDRAQIQQLRPCVERLGGKFELGTAEYLDVLLENLRRYKPFPVVASGDAQDDRFGQPVAQCR
jgi:hypothetical protein